MIINLILTNMNFSKTTESFLGGWFSGGASVGIGDITDEVVDDLKLEDYSSTKYRPEEDVTLYRGLKESDEIDENDTIVFSDLSSWTYDFDIAQNFTDTGVIVATTVKPTDVFIDSTMLDAKYINNTLGGVADEAEVILKPGSYKVQTVTEEQ